MLRVFKRGGLVLRRTFDEGKFNPNWEGPFTIINEGSKGAYRLLTLYKKMESNP